ncbi:protein strawberry notch homolog 2-like isoform X3 [Myxocyprinus asiaticus]|uniref:protein strawberry notch homolog 2-like isoform X3 n=1 Tax=Myxocyprinus asiaticus TaxID=70543 RepID=UPI002221B2DE|nr:protein strawberry notch homolog 2-like isoform X3 [Myxocyprinus asiaticus]
MHFSVSEVEQYGNYFHVRFSYGYLPSDQPQYLKPSHKLHADRSFSFSVSQKWLVNDGRLTRDHVSALSLMPSLATSVVMETEDYLHPEGPQLGSPNFSAPSPPLTSSMESQLYPSNSWVFSQQTQYNQHYPMQSERQLQSNSSSVNLDLSDIDIHDLVRNGDFSQDLSGIDELSNTSLFSSPSDTLSEYADPSGFCIDSLAQLPTEGTAAQLYWDIPGHSQRQQQILGAFPGRLDDISAIHSASVAGLKAAPPPQEEEEEADEEETEELGHADTYAEYKPSKSTIGISHPDIVVETNTLSSVPPPDITYTLSIPDSTINSGQLSALQLEAITYACQQHEVILQNGQRAGFLIGDGAGVGKGRTVAGIILENFLKGRKRALWFSVSNDLKYDAERDLKDIDAPNIPVFALNKIKYGDTATSEGVLFATYSALIGESQAGGQHRTRLKQILDWCRPNFDGVIVFDECHKAKNATSTKMGKAVLDLQSKLPRARVVYASATGASEPKNMIYMSRLGIWGQGTPFKTFDDFLHAIEKRGVGAMEIVAMDMKVSGMYIARQLSFSGVSFRIEEITLDEEFKLVYNKAARLWAEALELFTRAADVLGLVSRKSLWGQFWSSHQRFFKYLCIAAKVRRLVELAQEEIQRGKSIVIGLQSTGEARTREVLDENDGHLDRFVSAAEGVFQSLVQKHFPTEKPKREKSAASKRKRKPRSRPSKFPKHCVGVGGVIKISDDSDSDSDEIDSESNSSPESLQDNDDVIFVNHINGPAAKLEELKQRLLGKIAELGKELPLNTLDELIDRFGGPEKVSEMTGRKGRVVRRPDGSVRYETRAEQGLTIDHVNIREKERFMSGDKLIAIISEAASSGISLQADKRVQNRRRRVHMTLELPWSADRAIQQFGRTHRSNQVTAPEYIFLISELAGERRFASIVAKRLESLGALTHGDRRATESRDLSQYNFENKYGTKALDKITKAVLGHIDNKVPPPKGYPGGDIMFFRDMKKGMIDVGIFCKEPRFGLNTEKDCSITKFLNRILGLEVYQQNSLFQYFTDNFDYLINKDKKEGKYDMGILDLAPGNDEIHEETQEKFLTPGNPQEGQVMLYKISVDRGMPWEEAYSKAEKLSGDYEGFYLSNKLRGSQPCVLLAEQGRGRNLILYKPNIGKQAHPENLDNLLLRYNKVTPEEAKDCWESQFHFSFTNCTHANWNGKCKLNEQGQECFLGMRLRQYHMLCGALLRVWKRVSDIVSDVTSSSILQIVRLKTKQNSKQVGIKIPENCVSRVRAELSRMDEEVKKARRKREQLANDQRARVRQEMLAKIINARKLCANPALTLPNHLLYPRSLLHPTMMPKSEAVSEVLDLTISPCPSPDIKTPQDAGISLNSVSLNGGIVGGRGRPGVVAPETFGLEDLISQEQQRHKQVTLNSNLHVSSSFNVLRQPQQHVHTLKQNHSSLGVLTQQQNSSRLQQDVQASARYSTLLSQLHGGQDKTRMLRLLTQMRQQTGASSQSTRVALPSHRSSQHANMLTHNSNALAHSFGNNAQQQQLQVHGSEHRQVSLSRALQSQPLQSQSQPLHSQSQFLQSQPLHSQSQSLQTQPLQTQSQFLQSQPLHSQSQSLQTQPLQSQSQFLQSKPLQSQSQPLQPQSQSLQSQSLQSQSLQSQPLQPQSQSLQSQPLQSQSQFLQSKPLQSQSQPLQPQSQSLQSQPLQSQSQPLQSQSQPLQSQLQSLQSQPLQSQLQSLQSQSQSLQSQSLQSQPLQSQSQFLQLQPLQSQSQSLQTQPLQSQSQPLQSHSQSLQSHTVSSHSASKIATSRNNDFDFGALDFGCPSPVSQLQYPFTSQALPSSTPPPFPSSLFASAPPNSSLSDSSSSSSHFTPSSSSSEQSHLLLSNGHCSMDALDVRETLDHMIHGTPPDHRQSVIQFRSMDWDTT